MKDNKTDPSFMTFVYVIISSENDYILEQALVSMHSLKMFNPEAHITAVMDVDTFQGLIGERGRIKQYINEFITPEIPKGLNGTQKSRFLKTSLRNHIKGDFLFLDADTIVTDDLSEIQKLPYDVAITLNRHRHWDRDTPHPMIYEYVKTTGIDIQKSVNFTYYFNSGVIFSKDTEIAHNFFERWHQLWIKDSLELKFHKDQVAGWRANFELGNVIHELDPIYNCQFVFPIYALKYFESAKILHYIGSTKLGSCLKFTDKGFLEKILDYGINEKDEQYIKDIKRIYLNKLYEITDKALRNYTVEDTYLVIIARKISHRFPWINGLFRNFINLRANIKHLNNRQ